MAKAPVIRIPRPRVSEIELCAWVAQAAPGAVLEYHRGYLALDRTGFGHLGDSPARAALGLLGAHWLLGIAAPLVPPDLRATMPYLDTLGVTLRTVGVTALVMRALQK